jgi:hypothetical protein
MSPKCRFGQTIVDPSVSASPCARALGARRASEDMTVVVFIVNTAVRVLVLGAGHNRFGGGCDG